MSAARTFLGEPLPDRLVPFIPRHWAELRVRYDSADEAEHMDEAMGVALDMAALVRTVVLDSRPEAVVGLWLGPEDGTPWVVAPALSAASVARMIEASRPFIRECRRLRPLLRVETPITNDRVSQRWLCDLGFRALAAKPPLIETWELRPDDDV